MNVFQEMTLGGFLLGGLFFLQIADPGTLALAGVALAAAGLAAFGVGNLLEAAP